jgi:hypothetical protein
MKLVVSDETAPRRRGDAGLLVSVSQNSLAVNLWKAPSPDPEGCTRSQVGRRQIGSAIPTPTVSKPRKVGQPVLVTPCTEIKAQLPPQSCIFPLPPRLVMIIDPSLFRLADARFVAIAGMPSDRFAFAGPAGKILCRRRWYDLNDVHHPQVLMVQDVTVEDESANIRSASGHSARSQVVRETRTAWRRLRLDSLTVEPGVFVRDTRMHTPPFPTTRRLVPPTGGDEKK